MCGPSVASECGETATRMIIDYRYRMWSRVVAMLCDIWMDGWMDEHNDLQDPRAATACCDRPELIYFHGVGGGSRRPADTRTASCVAAR